LTGLTATQALSAAPFAERLRFILQSSARTLKVDRVGIWEWTAERSSIRCVDLFTATAHGHSAPLVLTRERYPRYFAALEGERLIAADDAYADERTSEFSDEYLPANGIGAMLDVPLRADDRTVGVLCFEHVGGPRRFTAKA
jgi:GAF domain-containing protein